MKNIYFSTVITALLVVIILFCDNCQCFGQNYYCMPDASNNWFYSKYCLDNPNNNDMTQVFTNTKIDYAYQLELLGMNYLGTSPKYNDFYKGFKYAVCYALTQQFPAQDSLYEGDVYLHFKKCWSTSDSSDTQLLKGCPFSDCCVVHYYREWVGGILTLTKIGNIGYDTTTCYTCVYLSTTNMCQDSLFPSNITQEQDYIKISGNIISSFRKNSEDLTYTEDNIISLNPNPAGNKVNILLTSSEIGRIIYGIYDCYGNSIETIELNKNNGSLGYDIDLTKYSSGLYILNVFSNGNIISNKTFLVIK